MNPSPVKTEGPSFEDSAADLARFSLEISGRVQGVGFRPFVVRLARELALAGSVANTPGGVHLEIQGRRSCLGRFLEELVRKAPSGSRIDRLSRAELAPRPREKGFSIRQSRERRGEEGDISQLLPDSAVCQDCLRELFDPEDRRFRYPLISCTACGPRYSIALHPPFDRVRTTLRRFPLCSACRREFEDPADRRFHAQTLGCPDCGPKTWFLEGDGRGRRTEGYLEEAGRRLRSGGVLLVKGLGGFHLACDARNREAILRIRALKNRPEKPLAVMAGSLAIAGTLARISPAARRLLLAPENMIVLLPYRKGAPVARESLTPGLDRIGLFLPSTPLHHLLFGEDGEDLPPLVMTSANPGGGPIAASLPEALGFFRGKVEGILAHGRPVRERQDDSLALPSKKGAVLLRRSRGWVPASFGIVRGKGPSSGPVVLALGAHQKIAPCRVRNGRALLLPHLGDLESFESQESFRETLVRFIEREGRRPTHLACDLHPDFPSSRLAFSLGTEWGIPVTPVQHHHAHVASVMADRVMEGPVLGLALDGFGLGTDGSFWGGELLRVDRSGWTRLGHFFPFPVPGGARAFREPWRMGMAVLNALGRKEEALRRFRAPGAGDLLGLLEGGAPGLFPRTTSAGRLFDAAYALLGGRERLSYEGQGAMELEAWGRKGHPDPAGRTGGFHRISAGILDFRPLFDHLAKEPSRERGARLFHEALATGLGEWVQIGREQTGLSTLILSGGVFQNRLLAGLLRKRLEGTGFRIVEPLRVPANDGGLALGQAWAVWARENHARIG
ncbi:MAG: carbamoyltransferase HypF [Nitrospiraceae bacterium]|nr:carbamoyltransferase HypF [Nitrospiraceae bacterium]